FFFEVLGIKSMSTLPLTYIPSYFYFLQLESCSVAEAVLKFVIILPQTPELLELQNMCHSA
ncbi:hypothetical protein V4Y02_23695, partial [Escherichia coli]